MTEMLSIFCGSANDFRCFAASRDCLEPSTATMTCISDPLSVDVLRVAALGGDRPFAVAEEVLDHVEHHAHPYKPRTPQQRGRVGGDHVVEQHEVAHQTGDQQ